MRPSFHLDFTFVSLVSGHPRPPVVTAPVCRGCPCRDPLGCLRCPGRMASGAQRQPLWLRSVGGGGHVMWTLLIHAFYKQTSSTREVTLLSLRVAPSSWSSHSLMMSCISTLSSFEVVLEFFLCVCLVQLSSSSGIRIVSRSCSRRMLSAPFSCL